MSKIGFYVKKLELSGNTVAPAIIEFYQGLNVIVGPSDTGKTFIYQCIDYMLGSSKIPKEIPESKKYNTCTLEIKSFNGDDYQLIRSLRGGDFKIKYLNKNNVSKNLRADNKGLDESISDFLLDLCGCTNKKIRKNAEGESKKLYFQDLTKYFLIDEETIIKEESPIAFKPLRGANIDWTFEKNVFKYLITGEDDSHIVSLLKPQQINNRKGKIELYDELIDDLEKKLKGIDHKEINTQIEKLDLAIVDFQSSFTLHYAEFKEYDDVKNALTKDIFDKETRLININEVLKRSEILKKQYMSDIARLRATVEAGQSFNLQTSPKCPLCNNEVQDELINMEELIFASTAEIKKILLLTNELESSQQLYKDEKIELTHELNYRKEQYDEILQKIQNELKETLENISAKIKTFTDKKEELSKTKSYKEHLEKYDEKRESLLKIVEDNKNNSTAYQELSTTLVEPITKRLRNILNNIRFDNVDSVSFSEILLDFSIGEKNRKAYGKGYRAVAYASFIIGLLEYLREKPYHMGFAMIDSPLNPYRHDDAQDGGTVPNNLADNFYKYLAENIKTEQVILIENTPVPQSIEKNINYIRFSKKNGFLLKE